jgi:hypothetical protein
MKKLICLFYAVCVFLIPVLFFMYTDPTALNLAFASLLSAVSGLASYNYFLTFKK